VKKGFRRLSTAIIVLSFFILHLNAGCTNKTISDPKLSLPSAALEQRFQIPPREAGVSCWWWWLNGNVTREAITKDLEAMRKKGFSGAYIFDAGGAEHRGNAQVPEGPTFGSPEWTELYIHALKEAQRLGLKLGLSIQSGWNLGGPCVTPEFSAKQLVWSEIQAKGPASYSQKLPVPGNKKNYYQEICVLAYPQRRQPGHNQSREPIRDLALKSGFKELGGSAPDTRFLLEDRPSVPGEEDVLMEDIQNITAKMGVDGTLTWDVPAGTWTVLRFGYTTTNAQVSTSSSDWKGLVIDYLSEDAFDRYWDEMIEPLLKKAGPMAGTVLKQLGTDSWECGGMNWSPGFAADFKDYCGYDPIPYLPVIAGKIVENREVSNAFLADFRKTLADCVSNNHYKVFAEHAARYKLGIQPESAGPHAGPLDGIKNYSHSDIVMSEFWVPSPHRPTPEKRFFVKQASSAAHIYGKQYVGAESFTSIGPHWNDVLWQSQKPSMDHEYCAGLNKIFFHTFTCSPKEMGLPGQEYFAGTHVNPQVTWWDYSDAFINYMNRIQSVVQQGQFIADVLYYYGDHVPNIAALKESDPARVMPGYDYDVTNEDVLLQLKCVDGKIVVPGGIQYRLLVLPDHKVLSLPALEKVDKLLRQGATVLGPKPQRLVSLVGGKTAQQQFHGLADQMWGVQPAESGQKNIDKGCLVWGITARQFLQSQGLAKDFEVIGTDNSSLYDYIHYRVGEAEVYFVCNQTEKPQAIDGAFRVSGRQPELWDPVTGQIRPAKAFSQSAGCTRVSLQFEPYGSCFVIFQEPIPATQQGTADSNFPALKTVMEIQGSWQVAFNPAWGGPASIQFDTLTDWTQHGDKGVKFYSGKAVYRKTFTCSEVAKERRYWLELNNVEDTGIAAVTLNGRDLGIVWTKPFRVEVTKILNAGPNQMEIVVVNSWRNRLVGDRDMPKEKRYTQTNITIRKDWGLLKSGLLGPVVLVSD